MKVVFVSSTYNHHQSEISRNLYDKLSGNYFFIETLPLTAERQKINWGINTYPEFVKCSHRSKEEKKECKRLINEADVVIWGSAPFGMLFERLIERKLTVRYSERLFKKGFELKEFLPRAIKHYPMNLPFFNQYLLCSSAYAAFDYNKLGCYKGKMYKWGYFPEVKKYDNVESLIATKKPASILWVARLIELKHPEAPIEVAKRLKSEGYRFTLDIIGSGVLEDRLKEQIQSDNLEDCVHMLGSMTPEQVREHMEQSEILLFTSDRNEGWGAVMNESMNSACAVVASHAIGSVPFMIEDGKNGLIYKNGNLDDLYRKVKYLLEHKNERKQISINAYETMITEWNAENAADKFIRLAQSILNGEKHPNVSTCGVCSKADILSDDWYKNK